MNNSPATSSVPPSAPIERNWFERHWWKLLIALILGGIGITVVCCGGIVFAIFGSLRSNEVVTMTIDRLAAEPAVIAHTGEPISAGWFVLGSIKWNNDAGSASLSVPVQGPEGTAEASVKATRQSGQWHIDTLTVKLEGSGEVIDLVPPPTPTDR